MGIDTNAILTSAPTIVDLMLWTQKYYKNVNVMPSAQDSMFYLNFKDGDDQRNVVVFVDNSVACDYKDLYTGDATFISMGMWGNSELIARKMVSDFGGWIRANDCTDDWKRLNED